jgi:hypothetical protein
VRDEEIRVRTTAETLRRLDLKLDEVTDAIPGRARGRSRCSATRPTTIGGLTPLLSETSLQAQFPTPIAITIVFGLVVTTFLVLFLEPACSVSRPNSAPCGRLGRAGHRAGLSRPDPGATPARCPVRSREA